MTFKNIKAELRREGITQRQVAESMDMSENNFSLKVNERIPMTVDEAKFIQREWLGGNGLDYLLESDGDVPSVRELAHAEVEAAMDVARQLGCDEAEAEDVLGGLHEVIDASPLYDDPPTETA